MAQLIFHLLEIDPIPRWVYFLHCDFSKFQLVLHILNVGAGHGHISDDQHPRDPPWLVHLILLLGGRGVREGGWYSQRITL